MPPVKPNRKSAIQDSQRAWLHELIAITNKSPTELANGAGLSFSTLTRFLNSPSYTGVLSPETIDSLKETYNVPGPEEYAYERARAASGYAEAERVEMQGKGETQSIGRSLLQGRPEDTEIWRLKTSALAQAGYLPGDLLVIDPEATPAARDVVKAHIYDARRGSTETIWRVYDAPYLVAAAADQLSYKPMLVDQQSVIIMGVVVFSVRPHPLSKTR